MELAVAKKKVEKSEAKVVCIPFHIQSHFLYSLYTIYLQLCPRCNMKIVFQSQFRKLVEVAEQYGKARLSTKLIKDLLYAPNSKVAEKCLALVPKEKGAGN